MKKVIICGAGIGGLTVAHELSKRNFDVTVYERNDIVGGLARSMYHTDPQMSYKYPVEYSWRIYGAEYKNLLRILNEIPLREDQKKTVLSNLVTVFTFIFARFDKKEVIFSKNNNLGEITRDFQKGDTRKILNKILYCMTMSTARMDSLDGFTWKEYCTDLSPEANKYLVRLMAPLLGMDPTYMSFPVIARMVKMLLGGVWGGSSALYVMCKPTNDGWFDEWLEYLQNSSGVSIKINSEIKDFNMRDGKIHSITVQDKVTKEEKVEDADYFVCAMSVEAIADIASKNKELLKVPALRNTINLAKRCRQIQLSIGIFLDQGIVYPTKEKLVLALPDTPWGITIEPEDDIWCKAYCTDTRVKTFLAVAVCQTDSKGIVHDKPFIKCTESEIQDEVWAQICRSYHMSSIKTKDGGTIDTAKIILFYIWDSYKFDKEKGLMDTWEPKFSNNIDSLSYQPSTTTEVPNLLFATAYTKTDRYIYCMEAAAEAGTRAANEIITQSNQATNRSESVSKIYPYNASLPVFYPLVLIDNILYKLRLPHLSRLTFNNSIGLVAVYVIVILGLITLLLLKIF
ncbi:hypothetical protein COB64_02495 [Candidatus Wolfebacteria bacterium]|nr:MAG: hypothetical protein COB64_02495 [Candidatus Wolfebacteria bacterium]